MPWGIIIDCSSVAVGGIIGGLGGTFFSKNICEYLSRFFGISSMAIGISLIGKASSLSPVMLALLIGAVIGEILRLEELLGKIPKSLGRRFLKGNLRQEEFTEQFTGVLVLLCSGSLGLMGAMTEGMTGDASILLTKSILDLSGAAIFASTLGFSVAFIALPQFLLYLVLFSGANLIMPFMTEAMIADFMGCGGVIVLVTGIRIAELKSIRVASLLPALLLVLPVSALWTLMLGGL